MKIITQCNNIGRTLNSKTSTYVKEWKSKKEIKLYIDELKLRKDKIYDLNLFSLYETFYIDKIQKVKYFYIKNNKLYGYVDNNIDIKLSTKILCNKNIDCLTQSLRNEIKIQISRWRNIHEYPDKCPITKKKYDKYEVDHFKPTFHELRDNFLKLYDDKIETSFYKNRFHIKDKTIAKHWRKYHKENATLRFISSEANKVSWR